MGSVHRCRFGLSCGELALQWHFDVAPTPSAPRRATGRPQLHAHRAIENSRPEALPRRWVSQRTRTRLGPPSTRQHTETRPLGSESAPYFTAFVASSCTAMASGSVAEAGTISRGPSKTNRWPSPMKGASSPSSGRRQAGPVPVPRPLSAPRPPAATRWEPAPARATARIAPRPGRSWHGAPPHAPSGAGAPPPSCGECRAKQHPPSATCGSAARARRGLTSRAKGSCR